MTDREISTAELAEDIHRVEAGVASLHARFDGLDARYVLQVVATEQNARRDAENATMRAMIDDIRRSFTWIWRAILTGVFLPIFVTIIVAFMLRGGG